MVFQCLINTCRVTFVEPEKTTWGNRKDWVVNKRIKIQHYYFFLKKIDFFGKVKSYINILHGTEGARLMIEINYPPLFLFTLLRTFRLWPTFLVVTLFTVPSAYIVLLLLFIDHSYKFDVFNWTFSLTYVFNTEKMFSLYTPCLYIKVSIYIKS